MRVFTLLLGLVACCLLCQRQAPAQVGFPGTLGEEPNNAAQPVANQPRTSGQFPVIPDRGPDTLLARLLSMDFFPNPASTIRDPGPDTADLPDSPYAVPPGTVYLETSLTYQRFKSPDAREYSTATLVRIGLVTNWELRLSSPGLIVRTGWPDSTSGFGPITIGAKWHWWDEIEESYIPAAGTIVQITTRTGADAFRPEIAEPTAFLTFTHTLPWEMEFEWNLGLTLTKNDSGQTELHGLLLWALTKELTPDLNFFVHGLMVMPGDLSDFIAVQGPGLIWFIGDRVALDASYIFRVTDDGPSAIARFGLSLAF